MMLNLLYIALSFRDLEINTGTYLNNFEYKIFHSSPFPYKICIIYLINSPTWMFMVTRTMLHIFLLNP